MRSYRCSRCDQVKPDENFYPARTSQTHRPVMYWCIRCVRTYKQLPANRAYDRRRRLKTT